MDEIKTIQAPMEQSPELEAMAAPVIGAEQLRKLNLILKDYMSGKTVTEARIKSSEDWWKLRNSAQEESESKSLGINGFKSRSGWLHNIIVSKHADAMDAYPEPNLLPREQDDKPEANILSAIIPCILEQNEFEQTYSDTMWQKLKTGTGVYKITWDKDKLNGLGDINISRCNLLNLFWEPGITNIQDSRYFFHCELEDKDVLEEQYPQLKDKLGGTNILVSKFRTDDTVSDDGKTTVIECYYHKYIGGQKTLQYVKYAGEQVIYATENEPDMALSGLYDHGMYPYVFDTLFPIEGSPCGYGFVDIARNPQTAIDLLNTAFTRNAMVGATPRYFIRQDGSVNEQEMLDTTKAMVHVNGNLGEDSIREIVPPQFNGNYIAMRDSIINELRETSGNTESATGTASSGVTAASAIAALQEASGKGSRDASLASYRAYSQLINLVIELIRQFYDMPRQFRIVGQYGAEQYVSYNNSGIQPIAQPAMYGEGTSYRLPVFDIKVRAAKKTAYTRMSQNELAIQFFQLGFFNPQLTDQALLTLDMMEFDGKDALMQKISRNGTMFDKLTQYMQLALQLAATAAPEMVEGLSQDIMQTMGVQMPTGTERELADLQGGETSGENTRVAKARAASQARSQPQGGEVKA